MKVTVEAHTEKDHVQAKRIKVQRGDVKNMGDVEYTTIDFGAGDSREPSMKRAARKSTRRADGKVVSTVQTTADTQVLGSTKSIITTLVPSKKGVVIPHPVMEVKANYEFAPYKTGRSANVMYAEAVTVTFADETSPDSDRPGIVSVNPLSTSELQHGEEVRVELPRQGQNEIFQIDEERQYGDTGPAKPKPLHLAGVRMVGKVNTYHHLDRDGSPQIRVLGEEDMDLRRVDYAFLRDNVIPTTGSAHDYSSPVPQMSSLLGK